MKKLMLSLGLTGLLFASGSFACEIQDELLQSMANLKKNTSLLEDSIMLEENGPLKSQASILIMRINLVERVAKTGSPQLYSYGPCGVFLPLMEKVARLHKYMEIFYSQEAEEEDALVERWSGLETAYGETRRIMELLGCRADGTCIPED